MSDYLDQLQNDILMTARQFGMNEDMARDFSKSMVEKIQNNHAGPVFIKKPDKTQRNQEISRRFNGVNAESLAREFGIHKSSVYRIAKHGK